MTLHRGYAPGEALSAMLVRGTADAMAMVPMSQAVEVDETRRLLQDELLADAACPQIIVQVGCAPLAVEQVPLTPRRPVDEVLDDVRSLAARYGPCQAEPHAWSRSTATPHA